MILIRWLGTAGFLVQAAGRTFLFDPHLSSVVKNSEDPKSLMSEELRPEMIFVSHGHVDHAGDLPWIIDATAAPVMCNETVANRLMAEGVSREKLILVENGTRYIHREYRVRVFDSTHAPLDVMGAFKAFLRAGPNLRHPFSLMRSYPAGSIYSFRLSLPGCKIQHFGSLGSPGPFLQHIQAKGSPDVLLLPLQRQRKWIEKAQDYIRTLNPRIVIPHHYDDSMPPVTELLKIQPALDVLARSFPGIRVIKLNAMECLQI